MSSSLTWWLFWPRDVSKTTRVTLVHCLERNPFTLYSKYWKIPVKPANDLNEYLNTNDIAYESDKHRGGAWEWASRNYSNVWARLSLPSEFEFRPIIGHPNVIAVDTNAFRILTENEWNK